MDFPSSLLHKGRRLYSSQHILSFNYMFARCPPSDWDEGDEFPDFNRIKIDQNQSFNWSAFSIPIWARFTDLQEYKNGYGVIGYKVGTIRKTNKINPRFDNHIFDLCHKPLTHNYSHCELTLLKPIEKRDRREIRMTFRHRCIRPLLPSKERSKVRQPIDYLRMYSHRIILNIRTLFILS